MHSYKNGNPNAKDMDDNEALHYADQAGIPMPVSDQEGANDQDAIAEQLQGTSGDAQGEVDNTPPAKAGGKKATAGRKRKSEGGEEAAVPASPAQKRRRASAKPTEDSVKEEPKKGRKKGKAA